MRLNAIPHMSRHGRVSFGTRTDSYFSVFPRSLYSFFAFSSRGLETIQKCMQKGALFLGPKLSRQTKRLPRSRTGLA